MKGKNLKLVIVTLLALFLSGCFAHSINKHNANKYWAYGSENEKSGNWFEARKGYGRAWTNATLGHAEDEAIAAIAYEYGRASGAICDWKEAEKGLIVSYNFHDNKHSPTLIELARMYYAMGNLNKSEEFFQIAVDGLEKNNTNLISKYPITFANLLTEYAEVLDSLGKVNELKGIKKKEEDVRKKHQGQSSNFSPTPYGKFCDQNPQLK